MSGLSPRGHQAGQLATAVGFGTRIDFGIVEDRIGDLHLAAAFLEEHRSREIARNEFRVIVDLPPACRVEFAMIDPSRLSQKAVDLPELVLFPLIERMVVALGALHLDAHEQARRLGGRLDGFVVVDHLGQQVIHRAVLVGAPFRGHQVVHNFVPRAVLGECLAEEPLHGGAIDEADLLAADRQVRPEGRPVADVSGAVEQLIDESGPLGRVFVPVKAFDLVPGRDMSHEIQMDATKPLFVVRLGRGLQLVVDPTLADLLIDEGHDRIAGTGAGRFLDPGLFGFGLFFLGVGPGFVGRRGKNRGGQQGTHHQKNERQCAQKERTKPAAGNRLLRLVMAAFDIAAPAPLLPATDAQCSPQFRGIQPHFAPGPGCDTAARS